MRGWVRALRRSYPGRPTPLPRMTRQEPASSPCTADLPRSSFSLRSESVRSTTHVTQVQVKVLVTGRRAHRPYGYVVYFSDIAAFFPGLHSWNTNPMAHTAIATAGTSVMPNLLFRRDKQREKRCEAHRCYRGHNESSITVWYPPIKVGDRL